MEHPITPPPELVEQWRTSPEYVDKLSKLTLVSMTTIKLQEIATKAARWGADQELEASAEWVSQWCISWPDGTRPEDVLRTARRPRPTQDAFTKELALDACACALADGRLSDYEATAIRLALDAIRTSQD